MKQKRKNDPRIQIQEELLLAKQSRIEGNEGRARVCARRAAGAAVVDLLYTRGLHAEPNNIYQTLITFQNTESLPDRVQMALTRLIQRVDQDHQLPPEVDLIEEAKLLINFVEKGEKGI